MALDLSFAEVVRRRGILRTNLLVMDEVLSDLTCLILQIGIFQVKVSYCLF